MDSSLHTIGQYAASLSYDDLPQSSVHAVKQRIVDSLGCALGGFQMEAGEAARSLCPSIDAPFSARVIGSLQRSTPEMAAFANATMVRDLDHSDVYRPTIRAGGHPSNCICAPLALAEALGANGKQLITAIALGYEMFVPFVEGDAMIQPQFEQDGLMSTLASAMAAGKILALPAEQMSTAAALALVPNIGLGMRRVGHVTMYKELYAGMAARQGLFAALMARAGMSAPDEAVESKVAGLRHVVMDKGVLELGRLTQPGNPYAVERTVIKAFPIGGGVHLSAFAALEFRQKVRAQDIESVVVTVDSYAKSTSAKPQHWTPVSREDADHSIPVAVALALVDGEITVGSLTNARFNAPEVRDLMSRIRVEEDADFSRQYPVKKNIAIEARTRDGQSVRIHKIMTAEEDRTSDDIVEAKFKRYARDVLTTSQAAATLDLVWKLDKLDHAGRLLDQMLVDGQRSQ